MCGFVYRRFDGMRSKDNCECIYSALFSRGEIHSHKNGNETTFYWTHMWLSYLKCYIMLKGGSAIVNNIRPSQLDSIKEIKAKPQPKQCFFFN